MIGEKYHFIGVGGIGMSALARILLQKGCAVQGSDQAACPLLEQLRAEGAQVFVGHNASLLNAETTVIYSSGVKEKNEEFARAVSLKLPILHRSDLLDRLMKEKKPLLVTGTHGKTTTSSLLAFVLYDAGLDPAFAVGGIVQSLHTNGRWGQGPFFVAEADESDGSFLKTAAFGGIVTNLDHDHLDYWGSEEKLYTAFRKFFSQAKRREHLFWCADDSRLRTVNPVGFSYGFSAGSDAQISAFEQTEKGILFDLFFQGKRYHRIALPLFGRHNALNGAAVFALAFSLDIPEEKIRSAFAHFAGTQRRFEHKGTAHGVTFFDDYGHHPAEIEVTLQAFREYVGERRLIAIFQPHRYTRIRDLFERFLHCFHHADVVILTDIYSAGESPIEGITTAALYTKMKEVLHDKLHFYPRSHVERGVVDILQLHDAVLTIGAGDITYAGKTIIEEWTKKAPKMRVGVLFGGCSAEHEVSIASAKNVACALDTSLYDIQYFGVTKQAEWIAGEDAMEKLLKTTAVELPSKMPLAVMEALLQCDVCIPVFHGPQGEDGMIQGFFDTLRIPYVGCDYPSAALCMHKGWTKQVALMHHIPTARFIEVERSFHITQSAHVVERVEEALSYPVWVKPVHLGSSVGVGRADTRVQLLQKMQNAFSYDDVVVIEEHVEGRQIEFGVIGNEVIRVGPPCEILNEGSFVDYSDKYGPTAMGYAIPARITDLEVEIGIDLARRTYKACRCTGLARVDFFLDRNGYFWLNEINPFPGCTDTSAFPKIWDKAGYTMQQICDLLVTAALHRTRTKHRC